MIRSSKGGHVYTADAILVPNKSWRGNWRGQDDDATQSDTEGTLYFPIGRDDPEWEITLVRDDEAFPEALGWEEGTIQSAIYFGLGGGNKVDMLTNTTVREIETVVEQGRVVMVTVRGHGGNRLSNVTIPITTTEGTEPMAREMTGEMTGEVTGEVTGGPGVVNRVRVG